MQFKASARALYIVRSSRILEIVCLFVDANIRLICHEIFDASGKRRRKRLKSESTRYTNIFASMLVSERESRKNRRGGWREVVMHRKRRIDCIFTVYIYIYIKRAFGGTLQRVIFSRSFWLTSFEYALRWRRIEKPESSRKLHAFGNKRENILFGTQLRYQ